MSEEIIYQDQTVLVSTARVQIDGTTYALRNLTSVRMTSERPSSGCAALMTTGGGCLIIAAFAQFGKSDALAIGVLGLFCALLGWAWLASLKTTYSVFLLSSAGERPALSSPKEDYVKGIVAAINEAIIRYR